MTEGKRVCAMSPPYLVRSSVIALTDGDAADEVTVRAHIATSRARY